MRQPFPSNTGLRFSREMAVATIGPSQMLRSLCVIDTNSTSCDTSYSSYGVTKSSDNLYATFMYILAIRDAFFQVRIIVFNYSLTEFIV